jgi:hypothetical protein
MLMQDLFATPQHGRLIKQVMRNNGGWGLVHLR